MEISAGTTVPRWDSVAALYILQKSMMLMPCGPSAVPTGGAGVAWPAVIWMRTTAASFFFAIFSSLTPADLELGDLAEFELDRRLPSEDVDEHLELRLVDVDLADGAVEVGEGPGDDPDLLADVELQPRPGLLALAGDALLLLDAEDGLDLLAGERRRLGATPHEPGDAGGVAHDPPRVVVEVHPDEEVAGEHLLRDDRLPAGLELDDVLHGDDDLEDPLLHVHRADPAGQVRLHLVLVAGVGVDDEPLPGPVVRARLPGPGRLLLGALLALAVLLVGLEQIGVGGEFARLLGLGLRLGRFLVGPRLGGGDARVPLGLGEEGVLLAQVAGLLHGFGNVGGHRVSRRGEGRLWRRRSRIRR